MVMQNGACLIWGNGYEASLLRTGFSTLVYDSARAGGSYEITRDAELYMTQMGDPQKAKLTTWIIDQRSQGVESPSINRATIDYATTRSTLPAHSRVDRLLRFVAQSTDAIGSDFRCSYGNPAVLAWTESTRDSEVYYLLEYLEERNWIKGNHLMNASFAGMVTVDGYGHIADAASNVDSTQVFVAMWFDSSMNEAFDYGIKLAVSEAGFEAPKN